MRVDGQYHCGEITYEAEVEVEDIAICHCLDCQRMAGSLFRANVPVRADAFRVLTGTPRKCVKIGDSGAQRFMRSARPAARRSTPARSKTRGATRCAWTR